MATTQRGRGSEVILFVGVEAMSTAHEVKGKKIWDHRSDDDTPNATESTTTDTTIDTATLADLETLRSRDLTGEEPNTMHHGLGT